MKSASEPLGVLSIFITHLSTVGDLTIQIMIPDHGWSASTQSLQAPPPFVLPYTTLGLFPSPIFFFALSPLGTCSWAINHSNVIEI